MTNFNQPVSDNISITDNLSYVITQIHTNSLATKPSNVRSIIETYASDGSVSSRKIVNTLINAQISKDGDRAVDTAQFTFPVQTNIQQNNGVLYVQDIADVTFLRAIYNFHYNILDESGNALDGTSANEAVSLYDSNSPPLNFLGSNNYGSGSSPASWIARLIHSSGDQITVANASNIIDFSGQFDIMFHGSWLTNADSNANPKYVLDTEHGGLTGISIYLNSAGKFLVDMVNGGVGTTITSATSGFNDEKWHFVRVVRDSANLVRLIIDGNLEASTTISSSLQNNAADVTIGTTSAAVSTRIMNGCLLQLRIYSGGILSEVDAGTVYSYQPQPYTMKFGGIVWKIDDNTDSKIAYCKSFAKALGDIQLSYNNLTTSSGSPPTSPYIAHNVYVGKTGDLIIKDFASHVLSGWTVMIPPTFSVTIGKYVASGSFLSNIFYLLYTESGSLTFFTTARKVMIIESINKDHTTAPGALNFVGVKAGGKFDISNDGKDDTAYVNDVQITGAYVTATFHETATPANLATRSSVLQFAPISALVQVPAGTYLKMDNSPSPAAGTFQIDTENKQIVFSTAFNGATAYIVDYIYEDTTNAVYRNTDATGITQNGRYSKQYNLIQVKDYFSMAGFSGNILLRFGNSATHIMPRRIMISAPTFINFIRENYQVNVTNGIKATADSASFSNAKYTIKSFIYKYPEGTTTIQLGDFLYDMFDPVNATAANVDQNTQSLTQTKNTANS